MSHAQLRTLTLPAFSWFDAAIRYDVLEDEPSLATCFDRIVALCLRSISRDLHPALHSATADSHPFADR